MPKGFDSQITAFFLASQEDLLAGMPGARLPLDEVILVERPNPFTGVLQKFETRDPSPRQHDLTRFPRELPFEHTPWCSGFEAADAYAFYLALDLALAGEPGMARDADAVGQMIDRGLFVEGLYGLTGAFLFEVPSRISDHLAGLDTTSFELALREWSRRMPFNSQVGRPHLSALTALVQAGQRCSKRLYFWDGCGSSPAGECTAGSIT